MPVKKEMDNQLEDCQCSDRVDALFESWSLESWSLQILPFRRGWADRPSAPNPNQFLNHKRAGTAQKVHDDIVVHS